MGLQFFFAHSTRTDSLRERKLRFRLRVPPQRKVHRKTIDSEKSFNDLFCGRLTENREKLRDTLEDANGTELSLGSASAILKKRCELKEEDLYNSYLKNLEKGCEEFCENEELIEIVNECFEEAFRESFGKEPTGEKARALKKKT